MSAHRPKNAYRPLDAFVSYHHWMMLMMGMNKADGNKRLSC
jgi:hypothetical protein